MLEVQLDISATVSLPFIDTIEVGLTVLVGVGSRAVTVACTRCIKVRGSGRGEGIVHLITLFSPA